MFRRRRAASLMFVVLLGACAHPNGPGRPDGGGLSICPDHPQQCEGTCCGSECKSTSVDLTNCGACGVSCAMGELCAGGQCGCPVGPGNVMKCPAGQTCCGPKGCKNLQTDINNCGACNNSCPGGSTCSNGQCLCGGVACGVGQTCCEGVCSTTCAVDMAPPPVDLGGGNPGLCPCVCPGGCLSGWCVGNGCCYEQAFLGACTPDPICAFVCTF